MKALIPSTKPTPIKLADFEAYWLGRNFSFARTKDGAVWFWGEETAAGVVLGTRGNQRVPAEGPIPPLARWRDGSTR